MVAVKSEITTEDAIQFESWLQSISGGRSNSEIEFIRRACEVAQQAHHGQTRASGEPYFQHSLSVANILADLRLDYETIAAALLHDVLEDTPVTYQELEAEFGNSWGASAGGKDVGEDLVAAFCELRGERIEEIAAEHEEPAHRIGAFDAEGALCERRSASADLGAESRKSACDRCCVDISAGDGDIGSAGAH